MKKFISILLAMCFAVTVLPLTVVSFAAGDAAVEGRVIKIIRNGESIATTYNTFTAAYAAAKAGDIIDLPAGDYECSPADVTVKQARAFSISTNITIRGAADGVTRFYPASSWAPEASLQQKLFVVGGSQVVFENITIDCEGKNIDGMYTSSTGLTFKNTAIKNSGRSMLITAGSAAVTCDGLYIYSPETSIDTGRSYAHVDLTGGTLTFNSGIIHGALKVDGGTIVNNSMSLIKITVNTIIYGTFDFYMSPSFAAVAYSKCSYSIRTKIDSGLKNDATVLANTAAYYENMSNREISGTDIFGLSYADVLPKLVTLAENAGSANTDSKNRLSAVITKISSIKANADNSLSALSYTADTASAEGVPGYTGGTTEYNVTLPYECSPTAGVALSGTLGNTYGQIISLGNVTLADGIGSADATVWAYAANPQIKTYRVSFTVPKHTVSFTSGDNGTIDGTTQYSAFYGTLMSSFTLPVCTPRAGYLFDCWSPVLPDSITATETYMASFKRENTVVIPEPASPEAVEIACGIICGDTAGAIALMLTPEGGSAKILSLSGDELDETAPIATGMTVKLTLSDDTVREIIVVIKGDVHSDGSIDRQDFEAVLSSSVGAGDLSEAQAAAADINGDGVIDAFDAIFMELCSSGKVSTESFNAYSLGK